MTTEVTFQRSTYRRVDDDKLKELWPTRLPDKELAKRLGHHMRVLRRRAMRLGLRSRREIWSKAN